MKNGFIQIFVLLLLLLGIAASVYLIQQQTNIFSKAAILKPAGPETSFSLLGQDDCSGLLCILRLQKTSRVEEEFKVELFVRSDIDEANLFKAKITFPKDLIEVVNINTDSSFIQNWVEQTYDNNEGTISLVGGVPALGFKTEQGKDSALMATITFKTKNIGKGTLSFTDDSIIYRNTDNLNILTVKRNLDVSISTKSTSTQPAPFQIHLETCLTKYGQNDPRHYPAFWSQDKPIPYSCAGADQNPPAPGGGFYQNQTGKNLVLTRIVANLDSTFAAPTALTNAFADICVYAPLANLPQAKDTTTQSEVLCTNQFLASGQWTKGPQSAWDIILPGRGLLVQPGGIVACDAQIGIMENLNLQTASKFSCDLYFNDYDWDLSQPVVQSLRIPYVDEFFVGAVSRYAHHTNVRQSPLRTLGVWVYNGTKGKKTDVCLSKTGSGAGRWCDSVNEETVESWNSEATWQPFSEVLAPGDKISATCNTTDTRELKDCALYFMVEVPEDQPPLYPADSITESDRNSYCNNHDLKAYPYVDASFNVAACQAVLSRKKSPGVPTSITTPSPTSTPLPTAIPTPNPPSGKKGDGNRDGKIDLVDLSVLLSDFNKTGNFRKDIDMNDDKKINTFDFSKHRKLLIENGIIKE